MRSNPSYGLLFLFLALGCGPRGGPRPAAPAPPVVGRPVLDPVEVRATRPWRLAFVPKFKFFGETGRLSGFWQPAWEGARKAGADFGVKVELCTSSAHGATDSDLVEPQIRVVLDLIARGQVDGLIIAPFDSNRLVPVVERALAAGIATVALDTPVNSSRVHTFVSFDNFNAGKEMGIWVGARLGGRGRALVLDGPQDQQNAVDRRKGFLAGLASAHIEILNTRSGDWETEPARRITEAWLQQYPDVQAVLAGNDNMALGAAQAAEAAGRRLLITGFDATGDGLAAVKSGRLAATIDQAPGAQARLAVQLLVRRLETGAGFPPCVFLDRIPLVTRDNIGAYLGPDRSGP